MYTPRANGLEYKVQPTSPPVLEAHGTPYKAEVDRPSHFLVTMATLQNPVPERKEPNEDGYLYLRGEDGTILAVAVDGVGSQDSSAATRHIIQTIKKKILFERKPIWAQTIQDALLEAHRDLSNRKGSAAVAAAILRPAEKGRYNITTISAGDARVTLFTRNPYTGEVRVQHLTTDDTNPKVRENQQLFSTVDDPTKLPYEDRQLFKQRNQITQAIGDRLPEGIHIQTYQVDRKNLLALVVASDGVHDVLPDRYQYNLIRWAIKHRRNPARLLVQVAQREIWNLRGKIQRAQRAGAPIRLSQNEQYLYKILNRAKPDDATAIVLVPEEVKQSPEPKLTRPPKLREKERQLPNVLQAIKRLLTFFKEGHSPPEALLSKLIRSKKERTKVARKLRWAFLPYPEEQVPLALQLPIAEANILAAVKARTPQEYLNYLYTYLPPYVRGSKTVYSKEQILELITKYIRGELDRAYIPSNGGLRKMAEIVRRATSKRRSINLAFVDWLDNPR